MDQDQQEQEQDNNKNKSNPPPFSDSDKDESYLRREEQNNLWEMMVDLENIKQYEAALILAKIMAYDRRTDPKFIEAFWKAKNELQKKKAAYKRR